MMIWALKHVCMGLGSLVSDVLAASIYGGGLDGRAGGTETGVAPWAMGGDFELHLLYSPYRSSFGWGRGV